MVLSRVGDELRVQEIDEPRPTQGQILVRVQACGVCRTDLHILDGDLAKPALPLVLGHQVVGVVEELGEGVADVALGERVGIPWLGWTCGTCRYCSSGRENLCPDARFTGYDLNGGFAELAIADARYCLPMSDGIDDVHTAPLLCAGLIGWRALRLAGAAERVGLYGFGSAAHIVAQVALWQGRRVFAFTRAGDERAQAFARDLGCEWAGASTQPPPEELDAAILFAPAGELVPLGLRAVAPGGIVVCAEIHMSDIPSFPYELLWRERTLTSVANLTRRDGVDLLGIAAKVPIRTSVTAFSLEEANEALGALRAGSIEGAAVLVPG
jgi:propanol-preferring alcohol dehydrogenase